MGKNEQLIEITEALFFPLWHSIKTYNEEHFGLFLYDVISFPESLREGNEEAQKDCWEVRRRTSTLVVVIMRPLRISAVTGVFFIFYLIQFCFVEPSLAENQTGKL